MTSYDYWKMNDFDDHPQVSCRHCDDHLDRMYLCKDHLKNIIEQLYSKKTLDMVRLENDLDELAYILDVQTIPGDMTITRGQNESVYKIE